jgi:YD repeat-containing protein
VDLRPRHQLVVVSTADNNDYEFTYILASITG